MKVEVVRRGGMVALALRGRVDTADLPEETAAAAERALRTPELGREPGAPTHPHSFRYEITADLDHERRSVVMDEANVPDALWPLVNEAMQQGTIEPV